MILIPKELDLSKLIFNTPREVCKNSYYCSSVKNTDLSDDEEFLIQTPPLLIKAIDDTSVLLEIGKSKKYENLYKVLKSLEYLSINNIFENSKKWFGKQIPMEKIKLMYKSYFFNPDTMNGKFCVRFKKHAKMVIYDQEKIVKAAEDLVVGDKVICVLYINGLLFGKSSSKLDIRLTQLKIVPDVKETETETENEVESEKAESESDRDSDINDDYNFEPVTKDEEVTEDDDNITKVQTVKDSNSQSDPSETAISTKVQTNDTSSEAVVSPSVVDEEVSGTLEESEWGVRYDTLQADLKKCVSEGDMKRVQEIACEITELKKSK